MFLDQSAFLTNGFPGCRERYMIHGLVGWKKKCYQFVCRDYIMNIRWMTTIWTRIIHWQRCTSTYPYDIFKPIVWWSTVLNREWKYVARTNCWFPFPISTRHLQSLQIFCTCSFSLQHAKYRLQIQDTDLQNSSKRTAKVQSRKID